MVPQFKKNFNNLLSRNCGKILKRKYFNLSDYRNVSFILNCDIKGCHPKLKRTKNSAGKGPFTAGKAKNMHHRGVCFTRQAVSVVREMAPLLLGNLGAKF